MPGADVTMADGYLAAVAERLDGPRSTRAAILDELRDGLYEACAAWRARGLDAQAAVAAALREFGPPAGLARGFAGELATARARRIALAYLATGPMVGASWLLALQPVSGPRSHGPAGGLWGIVPALPAILVAVLGGLSVVVSTGRWGRIAAYPRPRLVLLGALMVIGAAAVGDLVMLVRAVVLDEGRVSGLLPLAVLASIARLMCGAAAGTLWLRCRRAFSAQPTVR